jgi:hypothetical protein
MDSSTKLNSPICAILSPTARLSFNGTSNMRTTNVTTAAFSNITTNAPVSSTDAWCHRKTGLMMRPMLATNSAVRTFCMLSIFAITLGP